MKEYLKKNGIRVGIIIAAVCLIIGLTSAAKDGKIGFVQNATGVIKSPIQKALSSAVNSFNTIYGYIYEYDQLLAENESLRSQLADAQQSARDGIAASEENVRLREALNLRQAHTDYEMESCKVVLWSTVSTLIDVDMSVGAFVGVAGNSGMVVGEYSMMRDKQAKLTYLADGAQIFVGDDVLTSGSGGAFPAGLVIGKLVAVQTEAGGQIEYGIVEPQCDLDSLVQVFIIKSFEVVE